MELRFRAAHEPAPNESTRRRFEQCWPACRAWFLKEGEERRPGYVSCRIALERHMPELVPIWEKLCDLAGGGDLEARMLSLYRPTPYLSGCSQAVWARDPQPLLVRNYDYHPEYCEGTILLSEWNGVKTIVQSDCIWGVLDGINEHGLVVSLSFGGRRACGDGFGIPLVLRYILQLCHDVDQTREILCRVPSHMAYNVLAVDRSGRFVNAHLSPGIEPSFVSSPIATNHQREIEWTRHAESTRSVERERYLQERFEDPRETQSRFVGRFLEPPLFNRNWEKGFGTLYTAVYDPVRLKVQYRWRNHFWQLCFEDFDESEILVRYQ